MKNFLKRCFFAPLLFFSVSTLCAAPGQLSLTLDGLGATAHSPIPLSAVDGLGLQGILEYRLSNFFALGLDCGLLEFLASPQTGGLKPTPYQRQNMKTIWLDLSGRFFPFAPSPTGEAYLQLGFGVSPHLGLFTDYWPNYTYEIFPGPEFYPQAPSTINWNVQTSIGYQFSLERDLGWDLGLQYDYFWPPADRPLQTLGLKTGIVFFFGGH